MKLKSPPPAPSSPTDPLPSSRRKSQPPWCVVTELRDLVSGEYHAVPTKSEVTIGRDAVNDIVLPYGSVSRVHVRCYPKPDYIDVHDPGSTNKSFIGTTEVQDYRLVPGTVARFGAVDVLAHSAGMGVHARVLDRLVGAVKSVNTALRAPREGRCLVFTGPSGACLDLVIAAAHGAATEGRTPLVTRTAANLAGADADASFDALLSAIADGWLLVDMRTATKPARLSLPDGFLKRLMSPAQGATLAVALEADEPTLTSTDILTSYQPTLIVVPSISVRIRGGGLSKLVNQIFAADGLSCTYESLHPDVAAAIKADPWQRNYEQLSDVLLYSGRMRQGDRIAGAGLITSANNALYWIDKLKLSRLLWGFSDD